MSCGAVEAVSGIELQVRRGEVFETPTLARHNPHTAGSGSKRVDSAVLVARGNAALTIASHRFSAAFTTHPKLGRDRPPGRSHMSPKRTLRGASVPLTKSTDRPCRASRLPTVIKRCLRRRSPIDRDAMPPLTP